MSGRNVSLTTHWMNFVDAQVESGRHQNASEVVREALRRYETILAEECAQIGAIQAVIRDGREAIARGEYVTVTTPEDRQDLLSRLNRHAAEPAPGGRAR
jgi:antitoxin ParD1/3/4